MFYTNQGLGTSGVRGSSSDKLSNQKVKDRFREFIKNFHPASSAVFVYREQLLRNFRREIYKVEVNLEDLHNYDAILLDLLRTNPNLYHGLFEIAAKEVLIQVVKHDSKTKSRYEPHREEGEEEGKQAEELVVEENILHLPNIHVLLVSPKQIPTPMRDISANQVNRLMSIPGIVISASRTRPKATRVSVTCKNCHSREWVNLDNGFGGAALPTTCKSCNVSGNMALTPDNGTYIDQQTLKLQELPEVVPTGEMPRSMLLAVNRYLVDQVSPGTRVSIVGVSSVINVNKGNNNNVRTPYIRVLGIEILSEGSGRMNSSFTPEEEDEFIELAKSGNVYERLVNSIAPAISGDYTVDIKKAIACLLFGGSRKILPDGMKLRGDINVLLLGDPSTAKSQFLKFVEKASPIGVYTSGKGSSAAGLTASVVKDSRGEFYLEGGAMVLADGGVVCIDEFDKMNETDRVAIHEAMEQQTISVAKAGITTILNSRASVLAAANPVFGTYDDTRSAAENIDFLPTILSRFDLIFIVKDIRDETKDKNIAKHIMNIHINFSHNAGIRHQSDEPTAENEEIDLLKMKKYIAYCSAKCAPRLSNDAAALLRSHYVGIREEHRKNVANEKAATVPITVRQLEAIIRISESLAKMELAMEAKPHHVNEAIRLFKVSTLNAANTGAMPGDISGLSTETRQEIQQIEVNFKRRIPLNQTVSTKKIMDEFILRQGFDQFVVQKAITTMLARNEIQQLNRRKLIRRLR